MAGSVLGSRAQDKGQRIQQARAMFGEVGNRQLMKMTLDNWPLGKGHECQSKEDFKGLHISPHIFSQ